MTPPKQADCCPSCGAPIPPLRWKGVEAVMSVARSGGALASCEKCREPLPAYLLHWEEADASAMTADFEAITGPRSDSIPAWVQALPRSAWIVQGVRVGRHG